MIVPNRSPAVAEVAEQYDVLDDIYREVWGEHIHHGLWQSGNESLETAVLQMIRRVADLARIDEGSRVVDIGCGYGATARWLARTRGGKVTGYTISKAQYDHARERSTTPSDPTFVLRDWNDNQEPDEAFDAAIMVESFEHFADKVRCVSEVARTLRPGGRLVMCAWTVAERPPALSTSLLLEPICAEGLFPQLGTEGDYRKWLLDGGLDPLSFEDVTGLVKRFWWIGSGMITRHALTSSRFRGMVRKILPEHAGYLVTPLRIALAYEVGALRYEIITARRPLAN